MNKIKVIDTKGNLIEANFVFAFYCDETKKSYVALDYQKKVFDKNSLYNNLDILEITKEDNNCLYVSDISDSDWEKVKDTIQSKIFTNI